MICGGKTATVCLGCEDCDVGEKRKAAWCCNESSAKPGKRACIEIHRSQVLEQIREPSNFVDV